MDDPVKLELRPFFRWFFSIGSLEDLLEEQFALVYNCNGGLTYREVELMPVRERHWFLERLNRQIRKENAEIKKASSRKR